MKSITIISLIFFLVVISCKEKEQATHCNFIYQPMISVSMKYNFNADSLYINHFKIKTKVKLSLKEKERLMLQQFFFKYKFDTINKDIIEVRKKRITSHCSLGCIEIVNAVNTTHYIGYCIDIYGVPINKTNELPNSRYSINPQDFEKEKSDYHKEHINLIRFKLKLDSILYQNEIFVKWNNYRIRYDMENKIYN